mmetsp:Transcript_4565/g.7809  ORF Transcript_4565/g.7809 Transcript_4565/m.7809 type:complete len:204 (-) Transcript_4565:420-1031(-)
MVQVGCQTASAGNASTYSLKLIFVTLLLSIQQQMDPCHAPVQYSATDLARTGAPTVELTTGTIRACAWVACGPAVQHMQVMVLLTYPVRVLSACSAKLPPACSVSVLLFCSVSLLKACSVRVPLNMSSQGASSIRSTLTVTITVTTSSPNCAALPRIASVELCGDQRAGASTFRATLSPGRCCDPAGRFEMRGFPGYEQCLLG